MEHHLLPVWCCKREQITLTFMSSVLHLRCTIVQVRKGVTVDNLSVAFQQTNCSNVVWNQRGSSMMWSSWTIRWSGAKKNSLICQDKKCQDKFSGVSLCVKSLSTSNRRWSTKGLKFLVPISLVWNTHFLWLGIIDIVEYLEFFLGQCCKCCLFKVEIRRAAETLELDQGPSSRHQPVSPAQTNRW